jgi:NADPH2:quinone reductase
VATGGRFCGYGTPAGGFEAPDPDAARTRGITVSGIAQAQVADEEARRFTEEALGAAPVITPVIWQVYPLEQACTISGWLTAHW